MTEENRKLLTEFLGKKWHEQLICLDPENDLWRECSCGLRYWYTAHHNNEYSNHTFTTWQDLGDLKNKLVEFKKWDSFEFYAAYTIWAKDKETSLGFTEWLLSPERFCQLVADFLKESKP